MGTIVTSFDAGQAVFVITTTSSTCVSAVRGGTIIQVRATELTSGTSIKYDVRLNGDNGTNEILESNMFATLSDAVVEYEIRLT